MLLGRQDLPDTTESFRRRLYRLAFFLDFCARLYRISSSRIWPSITVICWRDFWRRCSASCSFSSVSERSNPPSAIARLAACAARRRAGSLHRQVSWTWTPVDTASDMQQQLHVTAGCAPHANPYKGWRIIGGAGALHV